MDHISLAGTSHQQILQVVHMAKIAPTVTFQLRKGNIDVLIVAKSSAQKQVLCSTGNVIMRRS